MLLARTAEGIYTMTHSAAYFAQICDKGTLCKQHTLQAALTLKLFRAQGAQSAPFASPQTIVLSIT